MESSKFLLGLVLFVVGSSLCTGAQADENNEYSFNWLDPDKKIYVLQNRKYLKTFHPIVNGLAGFGFSNPYRSVFNLDGRLTFFMSENWGLEVFYLYSNNTENTTVEALKASSPNIVPSIRELRSQVGGRLLFSPWYSKINVFNSILYFDWYFSAGAGSIASYVNAPNTNNFQLDNLTGFYLGTGHLFHVSQQFLIRWDITATIFQAAINGTTGNTSWYSSYNFGLGLGWKL